MKRTSIANQPLMPSRAQTPSRRVRLQMVCVGHAAVVVVDVAENVRGSKVLVSKRQVQAIRQCLYVPHRPLP